MSITPIRRPCQRCKALADDNTVLRQALDTAIHALQGHGDDEAVRVLTPIAGPIVVPPQAN